MNRKIKWKPTAAIALVVLSTTVYFIHFLIFRDAHYIFIFLIGDIAFVLIEVLMVTIIIHYLDNEWEKKAILRN